MELVRQKSLKQMHVLEAQLTPMTQKELRNLGRHTLVSLEEKFSKKEGTLAKKPELK